MHNAKKCVSKVVEQVINWSTKSTKTFGHAFLKHGEKNLKKLIEIARQKKIPQGMWKNNEQAAEIIKKNFDNLIEGENIIDIPKGIGQVINPDGSIIEATKAIVVKNADGATNILTTAYPKIIP